jgi:hypothetical protein
MYYYQNAVGCFWTVKKLPEIKPYVYDCVRMAEREERVG